MQDVDTRADGILVLHQLAHACNHLQVDLVRGLHQLLRKRALCVSERRETRTRCCEQRVGMRTAAVLAGLVCVRAAGGSSRGSNKAATNCSHRIIDVGFPSVIS